MFQIQIAGLTIEIRSDSESLRAMCFLERGSENRIRPE